MAGVTVGSDKRNKMTCYPNNARDTPSEANSCMNESSTNTESPLTERVFAGLLTLNVIRFMRVNLL